ncbi:hypothetical protein C5C95_15025 [Rathayibacter sp. AY1B7]|uniref:hypothetical protein n=1 Tax=unclassified Rathayibacter TaxID=2609250 RepID=UPI000CE7A7F4|nr:MULTISPECIES: hypothetical protein [unclassified Rathayibacter]PPH86338.1 hypothetical protein C5C64_15240 [Rathayibacter sp. AY1D3]PPH96005.1 hypothetical protein C5C95_15025 [Rathayibacter sp. AY1B7]
MTIAPLSFGQPRCWHPAFSASELMTLQTAIPWGIHEAQARTGRANREYADPDDELYVYGVGMSRAVPKDIRVGLVGEASFREEPIPRSSRKLMFIGQGLIFPIRVGEKMRRNTNQLYLPSLSRTRRAAFAEHSSRRPELTDLTLFDDPADANDDAARIKDVLHHIEEDEDRTELFVAFYSSSPRGVGQIMWAPARLDGNYLRFLEPETLTFRKVPQTSEPAATKPQPAESFADAPRPRTTVKLRTSKQPDQQDQ